MSAPLGPRPFNRVGFKHVSSIEYATPKQVALISARAKEKGLRGTRLLEFIEYECSIYVDKLEDLEKAQVDLVLKAIEEEA